MSARLVRPALAALAALALAALAACGGGSGPNPTPSTTATAISDARCQQNQDAGTITYMTGYYYQSSASILEVLAADKLGYFDALCLDVQIKAGNGDPTTEVPLLASGKVQIEGLAEQDLIQNNLNGLKVTGVSSYSDAGLDVLMTEPDVTDLTQLDGKTLGYKGYMPIAIQAMADKAGVDWDSLHKVKVGYDPTVLGRTVDALTGFISNEPLQLQAAGHDVKVWQPSDYGIASSLGSFAINPDFGQKHPTAVQDFLRAVFKAFQYCADDANVDECIGYDKDFADPTQFDADHEKGVWTTEVGVYKAHPVPTGFGTVDMDNVAKLADLVSQYGGQQVSADEAKSFFDDSYVAAIMDGDKVIWPAP